MPDRDSLLVENTLRGDMAAFELLVQQYQQRLYSFLLKMTFSKEEAEELLQEVFIRAYNYLYRYDPGKRFSSWIYSIAVNTFKTEYKKKKKLKNTKYFNELPYELCSYEACPEEAYMEKESYHEIIMLIRELKYEQKTAFLLKHVQGFTYKDIGEIMGISAEAAKMKAQRAKHTLLKGMDRLKKREGGI